MDDQFDRQPNPDEEKWTLYSTKSPTQLLPDISKGLWAQGVKNFPYGASISGAGFAIEFHKTDYGCRFYILVYKKSNETAPFKEYLQSINDGSTIWGENLIEKKTEKKATANKSLRKKVSSRVSKGNRHLDAFKELVLEAFAASQEMDEKGQAAEKFVLHSVNDIAVYVSDKHTFRYVLDAFEDEAKFQHKEQLLRSDKLMVIDLVTAPVLRQWLKKRQPSPPT